MNKRWRDGLIIVSITLTLVFVLEGLFRAAGFHPAKPLLSEYLKYHPTLLWRNRPSVEGTKGSRFAPTISYRHNEFGLRMGEVSFEKPDDTIRISLLGDSNIWGFGVEEEKTAASVLHGLLNQSEHRKRIEVLNHGVIGYSSYQCMLALDEMVLPMKPDIVVAGFGYNDRRYVKSDGFADQSKTFGKIYALAQWNEWVFGYSALCSGVAQWFAPHQGTTFSQAVPRVGITQYKENTQRLIEQCQRVKVPIILVALPDNLFYIQRILNGYELEEKKDYAGAAQHYLAAMKQPNLTEFALVPSLVLSMIQEGHGEAVLEAVGQAIDDEAESKRRLGQIVQSIQELSLPVDSVMGMTVIRPDWTYRDALRELCGDQEYVQFLDFHDTVLQQDMEVRLNVFFDTDPCHLDVVGQGLLARTLFEVISGMLESI